MSARASLPATLIAVLVLILAACSQPAASPTPEPDETEAAETEAPETEEPEDDETSILALDVGDCFNIADEGDQTAEAVDCDDEHEFEVYATVEIDEDELPDDDELTEMSEDCFGEVFEDFVGVEYAESRWYATPFSPSEDDWDDGHEVIVCALWDPDEDETEGSAEGSEAGQAEETDEPEEPEETDGGQIFGFTVEALLSRIPPALEENCEEPEVGELYIVVVCRMPEESEVHYVDYSLARDRMYLDRIYDSIKASNGITVTDSGDCPAEVPAEGTYSMNDETVGRLACNVNEDGHAAMTWTDERLLIVAYAARVDGDLERLYDWWLGPDAGPVQ